jgi:hypothetical protein
MTPGNGFSFCSFLLKEAAKIPEEAAKIPVRKIVWSAACSCRLNNRELLSEYCLTLRLFTFRVKKIFFKRKRRVNNCSSLV